jgi:hypothetical protein
MLGNGVCARYLRLHLSSGDLLVAERTAGRSSGSARAGRPNDEKEGEFCGIPLKPKSGLNGALPLA